MTQENKMTFESDIIGLLDCSGSMESMGNEPPQAWNMFIQKQKDSGVTGRVSLYTFNHKVQEVYRNEPLATVEPFISYDADGTTALYDAVRLAVKNQLETGRTGHVVFVIITDGLDNASAPPQDTEFGTSKAEVAALLKRMEDQNNWQVLYLAADQDAFSVGPQYGAKMSKCASFSKRRGGLLGAAVAMSAPVARFRQQFSHQGSAPEINLNSNN